MLFTRKPSHSLCLLTLLIACSSPLEEQPFYLGGIQINEPDHNNWVETLDAVGMNTVSVTVMPARRSGTASGSGMIGRIHRLYMKSGLPKLRISM